MTLYCNTIRLNGNQARDRQVHGGHPARSRRHQAGRRDFEPTNAPYRRLRTDEIVRARSFASAPRSVRAARTCCGGQSHRNARSLHARASLARLLAATVCSNSSRNHITHTPPNKHRSAQREERDPQKVQCSNASSPLFCSLQPTHHRPRASHRR